MTTVRRAGPDDLADLIEMGREFFEQSDAGVFTTFDEPSFTTTLIGLISGVSGGILLVAEVAGRSVGMAACVVFPFYANMNTKTGQEIFWFCRPGHRSGIGQEILDELEAEAKRGGAHVFIGANLAGRRDKAFARFYRQRGYAPSEHTHIRVLSS
jgi:GNAT superfamily N-acetyltransferase